MPAAAPERAVADRWLDELVALKAGGAAVRYWARTRVRTEQVARQPGDRLYLLETITAFAGMPVVSVVDLLFGRWTHPARQDTHAEVALYPPGASTGSLPLVVVDFPIWVAAAVEAQGGEVDVRGEPAPGRAVALVLDDGQVVGCQYPAMPPPPVGARRTWGFRASGRQP